MTISMRFAAMGLLMGCGFAGGFMLSGVAREHSTLAKYRKADPGQLAKDAARALMAGAAASATSGKDDGSASQILSDVAAAGKTGSGQGDGAGDLAIGTAPTKSGGSGGKDATTLGKETSAGLQSLLSKAASSNVAAPTGPCTLADVAGAEAATVLLGNTVDEEGDWEGHEFVYFSPRHLMGRIRPASVLVKIWNPKAGELCEGTVCGIIRVRRCLDERLTTTKAGELQLTNGRWAPILRGNVKGFPTYIPFLDEARMATQPRTGAKPAGPAAKSRSGDSALVDTDRVYLAQRAESGDDARVMFYDRDGQTMDYAVPVAEAAREGVTINIGWWKLQKGVLCQGSAGDASHPSCYQPKKQSVGHVTLMAQDGRVDLVALPDPAMLRARDGD